MLSRTRASLAFRLKDFAFRAGGFQLLLEEKELRALSEHMGFRHQWDEHRRFQLQQIKAEGLLPGSRVLEIGCGPLTLGIPLIEFLNRGNYTGIDVRPTVLNIAHAQLSKANLADKNPQLLFSDSFGKQELDDESFDIVWSFSVLYHLTDELLDACFKQVARRMRKTGVYIANINVEMQSSTWLEFPFNQRDVSFYGQAAKRHGLKMTQLGKLKTLGFSLESDEKENHLLRFVHSVPS